MPAPLLLVSFVLPLTYGYDGLRAALLGTRGLLPYGIEVAVAGVFMVVTIAVGLWGFGLGIRPPGTAQPRRRYARKALTARIIEGR